MTLIALLTPLALSNTPVHVVPNTPVAEADSDIAAAEEKRLERVMREWIGSTNEDPEVEAVDVAIEPEKRNGADGEEVAALHLYGVVADHARRRALIEHAKALPGIAVVDDDLRLPGQRDPSPHVVPGALLEPNPRTQPEKAVVENLLESPFVEGRNIVVEVNDGRMRLTGTVEHTNEIAEAEKIAARTVDMPVDVHLAVD